jgi:hypothetical protein
MTHTVYRVHFPLITQDTYRDFLTLAEANAFASERRNSESRFLTCHSWRSVRVETIAGVEG